MKKYWLGALAVSGLLALTGCSDTLSLPDPTSLIRPPRLAADKEVLKNAIDVKLPAGATEVRTLGSEDTSTIHDIDLDGDGVNEAVVFYKSPDASVVKGMILQKQGNTWVNTLTVDGEGPVLDKLEFRDVTGDGHLDIVAGYGLEENAPNSFNNSLVIYSYTGTTVSSPIVKVPYAEFGVADFNGDGKEELALINFDANTGTEIKVYQYRENSLQELSSLTLPNKTLTSYYNVAAGKVSEAVNGLVLDMTIGTSSYTQLVVMKNDMLESVLGEDAAFKDGLVKSEDVNGDGIIEIGTLRKPYGWSYFEHKEDVPLLTIYSRWDGENGLKQVREQYRDAAGRYVLPPFPAELQGNVTLDTVSIVDKYLKFVRIDTREWLEEVRFFTSAQWQSESENNGWIKLYGTNSLVIAYRVNPDGDLAPGKSGIPAAN
ncbi:VCBS repeat-containing protein [Saccharibacillus sp. CPCC 101409]|uniref:FG-GAP repeat domain-containing protein n=1 Tax=Saccharibacillus sp. CPCC 101409 TaxID=3058041 RepID=UPI0026723956|nr:VCBS repeat-containing protein [Saccharibacillus sp. CPCC 101409]MDO3412867.1 VCBS repeat-containing protein [Saccharibacillus sp. CPCC 101409]